MLKVIKTLIRIDKLTGEVIEYVAGKKASIIELCKKGKLHPRKCRKYKQL